MEIYSKNKKDKKLKKDIESISSILYQKLRNWRDLKPIRGIIEDFIKVTKDRFGLGKFHSYTIESMSRKNIFMLIINNTNHTTRI